MATDHQPFSPVPAKFVWQQTTAIKSIFGVAASSLKSKVWPFGSKTKIEDLQLPGPVIRETLPPLDSDLVQNYWKWTSGEAADVSRIPEHLFPQWTFPLMASALSILPFPMTSVLNQGCKIEVNSQIPLNAKIVCSAQLIEVIEEEKKIRITTKITSGPKEAPDAIVAYVYAIIPVVSKKKKPEGTKKKETKQSGLPESAELIATHAIHERAGQDYAYLTGDFNPIHWIPTMAKLSGFKNVILHGFAQMALVQEDIIRSHCGGDASLLLSLDVRFLSPVVMPTEINVSIDSEKEGNGFKVYVTNKENGKLHMVGSYVLQSPVPRI
mmetsp:Transcript_16549/g.18718  ORF Transcript_16549/g.18718 Transcript_16549/m.18718 type:complete len:325 (-) Transcript_16549:152-1126(-)